MTILRMMPVLVLASAAMMATPVPAHMPYVLPSAFETTRDRVTVQASFGEDAFRAEIAMNDAPFEMTVPDGRTVRLPAPRLTHDLTFVEAALPGDGLYRVSSGPRLGRMGRMYRAGAGWTMVGDGDAPPPGVTLVNVRSATLADAYVLRGKPGAAGALRPRGKALELHPTGDPASYAPGTMSTFEILYDGKPLAGATATLFRDAGFYDDRKQAGTVISDARGRIALTPPDAGRYLLLVRHRTATPNAADAYTSFTTSVSFEVR